MRRRAEQIRIEKARAQRLADEVEAWRLTSNARSYVAALRERLPDLEAAERDRIAAWCEWAVSWTNRSDPLLIRLKFLDDDERDALEVGSQLYT